MTNKGWRKSAVNEALAVLYLRLNGYFTTGLVVHSPQWGQAQTEIDCFAVRHPRHVQSDRGVPSSSFLGRGGRLVDVVICEVKSVPSQLAFNQRLREDRAVLEYVLSWGGFFSRRAVSDIARRLEPLLQGDAGTSRPRRGGSHLGVRVRALLCCPPASDVDVADVWCLTGAEILQFADECFRPAARRSTCSTRYNFNLWGREFAPIIQYFKGLKPGDAPRLDDLYSQVGAA